jgi:hypothetical protein
MDLLLFISAASWLLVAGRGVAGWRGLLLLQDRRAPVHIAALEGRAEAIRVLEQCGANVHAVDRV